MAAKKTGKKITTNEMIIAVVGATGAQGGGLVNAILKDKKGSFAVRAITRDPNSAKAKALAEAGAGLVLQARQLGIPTKVVMFGGNGFNSPKVAEIISSSW